MGRRIISKTEWRIKSVGEKRVRKVRVGIAGISVGIRRWIIDVIVVSGRRLRGRHRHDAGLGRLLLGQLRHLQLRLLAGLHLLRLQFSAALDQSRDGLGRNSVIMQIKNLVRSERSKRGGLRVSFDDRRFDSRFDHLDDGGNDWRLTRGHGLDSIRENIGFRALGRFPLVCRCWRSCARGRF